jgi:hypothetical protein
MSPLASFLIGNLPVSILFNQDFILINMLKYSYKKVSLTLFFLLVGCLSSFGQLHTKIFAGQISIAGDLKPDEKAYKGYLDNLDQKLKMNPQDTTSLFFKALLLEQLNSQLAKPSPGEKKVYQELISAKDIILQLSDLKMKDFRLIVLRAQLYKDLAYQFSGDESWKYDSKEISDRRNLFDNYKKLANDSYDRLAKVDDTNAYDYQKLKVTFNYPIK